MLRAVNFAIRVFLIVAVAVVVFIAPWPGAGYATVDIAALAVTAVVLAVWVPTNWLAAQPKKATLHPYAFATVTVLCGAASATPRAGIFNVLSFFAALATGSELDFGVALVVAGLGIIATSGTGLALGAGVGPTLGYPIVQTLGFLLGRNLRSNRLHAQQADRLRSEEARTAALDERARIAREIHDVLAHSLGALGLQIQLARAVLTDEHDQGRALDVLDRAQRMANDGLTETKRAIHVLRGDTLPLTEGLAALGADHQEHHGARVTFHVHGPVRSLSPDAQLAITRTAQEALVNTAKHAPHQAVEISLDYAETDTSLVVRNHVDGAGRNPALATANLRYGLTGLRERLLLIDGTLDAGRDGEDWVVVATVPQ